MSTIKTIIFDLGGVLIDWNPEYVFLNAFKGDNEKMQWFLNTVCTMDWNENQDAGYPIAEATEDLVLKYPEYETYIRMYYGEWEHMIGGAIEGSVKVLKYFIDNENYKVVALTNWSAETFPIAQKRFDFLNWFEGIVVSGEEKTRKPFIDIYNIILNRYKIEPKTAIFIDDNFKNIETARKLSIQAIHFKNPKQLISELKQYNISI